MRLAPVHLTEIIEPVVTGMGYECVGIEYVSQSHQHILRVYIDAENGILLDDCSKVSHQLSGVLDVDDPISGSYQLEVSSPGDDRPLFKLEHFERFRGNAVRITLSEAFNGRKNFTGVLAGTDGDSVVLNTEDSVWELPFQNIRKARLVPDDRFAEKG